MSDAHDYKAFLVKDNVDEFRRERMGYWENQPPFSITGDEVKDIRNVVESFDWTIVENARDSRRESIRRMELWRLYRTQVLNHYKKDKNE